jgi:hypothetical protein
VRDVGSVGGDGEARVRLVAARLGFVRVRGFEGLLRDGGFVGGDGEAGFVWMRHGSGSFGLAHGSGWFVCEDLKDCFGRRVHGR